MTHDAIFFQRGPDLVPLMAAPYDAERDLQEILEHHTQLLAGAQMDRTDPRRFLLVRREAPVADHEGGGGRWSLDHLFLDQEAVPTLVEVKRSSNSEIRRRIVGQMLDYAANGPRYWSPEQLRQLFEDTCANQGAKAETVLERVVGDGADVDAYWDQAARNLRGGALRLVFVADIIPDELRAVIEFLNARLLDTEVFGVEVRRYVGENGEACFVPRLVGEVVSAKKVDGRSLDQKLEAAGPDVLDARDRLAEWAGQRSLQFVRGAGSFQVRDAHGAVIRLYPTFRTVEFPLDQLYSKGGADQARRIIERLSLFAGNKKLGEKAPSISCTDALAQWESVLEVMDELLALRTDAYH